MILLDHTEPSTVPDHPNGPPPSPPAPFPPAPAPAPDVVPVSDPQLPEHPEPIKEPPTYQPPIATRSERLRSGASRFGRLAATGGLLPSSSFPHRTTHTNSSGSIMRYQPSIRPLVAIAGLLLAASAFAATPVASSNKEVQSRYEQERARCLSGQSGQAQETCLKEAGAARAAATKGQLNDGEGKLGKNAKDRCDALAGDQRRDCMARMKGASNSTETGSVKGGGILRETVTVEPAPAASAAPR